MSLNTNEITLLQNFVEKKSYEKHKNIFTQGKISDRIYFIGKGYARLFYNVNGIEKTAFFYTKIQFICAGESYTFNIPAIENYQAVEQTEIYEFTKSKIKSLLIKAPKIDKLYGLRQKMNLLLVKKLLLLLSPNQLRNVTWIY